MPRDNRNNSSPEYAEGPPPPWPPPERESFLSKIIVSIIVSAIGPMLAGGILALAAALWASDIAHSFALWVGSHARALWGGE